MSGNRTIADTGSAMIVGEPGKPTVTINDRKSLEELRKLLADRKKIGVEISKKLKSHGIQIAGEEETVVIPPPTK